MASTSERCHIRIEKFDFKLEGYKGHNYYIFAPHSLGDYTGHQIHEWAILIHATSPESKTDASLQRPID